MNEQPIPNEAIGYGEAIPDPKPAVCDVYGVRHHWYPVEGTFVWLCPCGEAMLDELSAQEEPCSR